MKNLKIFFTLILMSSLSLTAQNKDTQIADKYFAKYEFVEAIEAYSKLVEKGKGNEYVYAQLAEANYNIFSTTEAEQWYAKALESNQDPEMIYKYSQMLKANGKYDESNKWMKKFADAKPKDDRAKAFKSNPDYIPGILEGEKLYELSTLEFNSEFSDYGGTVRDGNLYFSSARNKSRRNYGWNEEPYLDIYQVALLDAQEAELLSGDVNTRYHEGLTSFSPDGNTMYFSRESFFEGDYEKNKEAKTKKSLLYLFSASKEGDKWGNVQPLTLNNKEYSVKSPSVSKDGKTLYFASDMPGGKGLFDIYKVAINSDGSFGTVENLGEKVNTEGQEMFPYISDKDILYFSSNGHLGLGGLDVFHTTKSGDVVNAGVPVNSNADDLAFTINEETGEGFVSSNREGGKGNDDIYAVKRLMPCLVDLTTTVVDNVTNNPLAGVAVTIKDASGRVVANETSNNNGQVKYTVSCDKTLEISGVLKDYLSNSITFSGSKDKEASLQLNLDPIEVIIVEDKVVLNPIYFEFDKSNITEQGAFELDKLVAVMTKYPEMVILAESHTDSRGPASYNERLSDRRAKSTVQYVISKGIDASRISGIGKGESEPKIDCGSKCTEEEYQTNRRSEFIIVSGGLSDK
ncbi:OmpA family protein [Xanthomarina spongicola]|uniref:Outer membrane protein OmpA-like peptidoglycan-associated protein n=1 Tax=Xanthomarina spongicola TaxID=570520 RepID=A0A316DLB0_9FLAO|nr:OmpA family protein [Xanthomarina spongicola]PWK18914.1 outer membrane protein OmpA-like peptidoglycan-associated protein [Xanthomarina spongicola]